MDDLARMFAERLNDSCHCKVVSLPQKPDVLKARYEKYVVQHDLKPGDLVQWKEGMKNRRNPEYGQPVVLVEILSGKRSEVTDSGTPYYNEPLDAAIGIVDNDGDFLIYHMNLKRLEPYRA